jgi:hypothetical protein
MCVPGATLDISGELSGPKISSTNILSPKEKSCASTNGCQKRLKFLNLPAKEPGKALNPNLKP